MFNYILAVTGASGSLYPFRLLNFLLKKNLIVHLVISEPAQLVAQQELGHDWDKLLAFKYTKEIRENKLKVWDINDFSSPIASGSFVSQGMMIVPTSMSTLAAIAHGLSSNLIQRAADVMIKEKRPLVLVPRETPLSTIHLKNMLDLCQVGVHIVPPVPAFYCRPKSLEDIVDFALGRILDVLGIEHELYQRWTGQVGTSISKGGMMDA